MSINWKALIVLVLGTAAFAKVSPPNKLEEGLLRILDRWRSGDVGGLPVALPPLARLELGPRTISKDGYTMALGGVVVGGLERLSLAALAARADMSLLVRLSVPALRVTSDNYHLTGGFWFRINDRGSFKAKIDNVRASARVVLSARGGGTAVTDIHVDYAAGRIESHLSGSSWLVNKRFAAKLRSMLADKDSVARRIETAIAAAVNDRLRGITPQQLVEAISNA